jgi:two-component system phosphate regulon sensor histidine kinase PhoR
VLQQETGRLSERIERLLDWGRMEAGRRVYEHRPEEVRDVVDEAVKAFGAVQLGKKVDVAVDISSSLPTILADRHALVDALVNLLTNAVKYSENDKRIAVSAVSDGRTIRIAVRDNGMGIPRSEHSRIFQKFYRIDDRLSRAVEGSGLGLAIVRHVATGHGGKVEVDSEPGRGSTFTIVLPQPREQALQRAEDLSAAAEE